jgi:hypothetical protein
MKNFIELTSSTGAKFLASVYHIQRIVDIRGARADENTYIVGLNNNGGFYVRETYSEIVAMIKVNQEENYENKRRS